MNRIAISTRIIGFFLIILQPMVAITQESPTLAVGLETLTLKKGDIDVEALTAIIMKKQRELKHEALRRFMLKMFPESNYTTKYYVQSCLNILLYENNPQVIEKEILELTTNYALAIGIARVYYDANSTEFAFIDNAYKKFTDSDDWKLDNLEKQFSQHRSESKNYVADSVNLNKLNIRIAEKIKNIEGKTADEQTKRIYKELITLRKEKERLERKLMRMQMRKKEVGTTLAEANRKFPFGLWVDVVSDVLSGIPELKKKGFFVKPINYKEGEFYSRLKKQNPALPSEVEALHKKLKTDITHYVKHHDVIKEYFSISGSDTTVSVKEKLSNTWTTAITRLLGQDSLSSILEADLNETEVEAVSSLVKDLTAANTNRYKANALKTQVKKYNDSLIRVASLKQRFHDTFEKNKNSVSVKIGETPVTDTASLSNTINTFPVERKLRDAIGIDPVSSEAKTQEPFNDADSGAFDKYALDLKNTIVAIADAKREANQLLDITNNALTEFNHELLQLEIGLIDTTKVTGIVKQLGKFEEGYQATINEKLKELAGTTQFYDAFL